MYDKFRIYKAVEKKSIDMVHQEVVNEMKKD